MQSYSNKIAKSGSAPHPRVAQAVQLKSFFLQQNNSTNAPIQKKQASAYFTDNRPQAIVQKKQADALANKQPQGAVIQNKANATGLPDNLKSGIENLSGYSMDDVKVHYNSSQPAQLNAHAYAQGANIHIASGQEKHLPHEAWHVVQQKQGRVKPTLQMKGKVNVNDDKGLEKEADVMGAKAMLSTSGISHEFTQAPLAVHAKTPVQRVGDGLADQAHIYGFAIALSPEKLKPLGKQERTEYVQKAIAETLKRVGVPVPDLAFADTADGEFIDHNWSMKIPAQLLVSQNSDELAEIIGTLFHEIRHAEQYFRVAQHFATTMSVKGARATADMPPAIKEKARASKGDLAGATHKMHHDIAAWTESLSGNPARVIEEMNKAGAALSTQRGRFEEIIVNLVKTVEAMVKSPLEMDPDRLAVAIEMFHKADHETLAVEEDYERFLLAYRRQEHEADAHRLGWEVQDIARTGRPVERDMGYDRRLAAYAQEGFVQIIDAVQRAIADLERAAGMFRQIRLAKPAPKKASAAAADSDDEDFDDVLSPEAELLSYIGMLVKGGMEKGAATVKAKEMMAKKEADKKSAPQVDASAAIDLLTRSQLTLSKYLPIIAGNLKGLVNAVAHIRKLM